MSHGFGPTSSTLGIETDQISRNAQRVEREKVGGPGAAATVLSPRDTTQLGWPKEAGRLFA
jgi:hypothetical protein